MVDENLLDLYVNASLRMTRGIINESNQTMHISATSIKKATLLIKDISTSNKKKCGGRHPSHLGEGTLTI